MALAQKALGLRSGPPVPAAVGAQKPASPPAQKNPSPAQTQQTPNPVLGQTPQLPDSQQIIDGLPLIGLSGIKPGDVIAVTSAASDSPRVSAIKLVAGVDLVINAINARAGQRQMIALSAGLPLGVFDYGLTRQ